MRMMKDERLMIEGLKHIRRVFILQNIVILGIIFIATFCKVQDMKVFRIY
ncbi:hypothetical protein EC917_11324 [Bacillus thuringiensis]|uniref:Uncharacterized protein n=1 Tax=Bacillus thuringiensis TaxID=1428 RepID=A0A4R4BBA6_BACTU|nr:hypothetical protein EC917_11324 [Bacillus thuringiensis]TCW52757.1 hypothetical protein EC910_11324 [Bacillus thuringiensis]